MFLSNKQRETKRGDVRAGDLPWGGKHFPAPSSPSRWLGSTGRRRCTPRCARTVCKHKKNSDCSVCTAFQTKLKTSSFLSSSLLLCHLFLPLTWCSRSDTESCPLCCSRWCQCPPAGLGSKSTWGNECASSAPWRRAGSGLRSSPRILHKTWGPAVRLTLGCSPCCCGPSKAPTHTQRTELWNWDRFNDYTQPCLLFHLFKITYLYNGIIMVFFV